MNDLVIIGAGPSGMSAALYAGRANLKTTIIEKYIPGGQMLLTNEIENYPGYDVITGSDLSSKMLLSIDSLETVNLIYSEVLNIKKTKDNVFEITLLDNELLYSKTVLIATGTKPKLLGISGEEEFRGRGVSYCALCDGNFFHKKDVIVVGGGDSAIEEAIYLSKIVNSVTVLVRKDKLRAKENLQKRALQIKNINILFNKELVNISGDKTVNKVTIYDNKENTNVEKEIDGIFIYIGSNPISDFISQELLKTNDGWIKTDELMKTSVDGLFASGDIRDKAIRQIATATSEGIIASVSVYDYLAFK